MQLGLQMSSNQTSIKAVNVKAQRMHDIFYRMPMVLDK